MIGAGRRPPSFRGKVHWLSGGDRRRLHGGGAGSVVGDTTRDHDVGRRINPLHVLEAFIGSGVTLFVFLHPGTLTQQRYSPIIKDPDPKTRLGPPSVAIVAFVLIAAIVVT